MDLYNILVIDSELGNLKALERTLRREYNIFLATNGEDALALMEQNDIALIIADYHMTGVNNVEVLERALRKHPDIIRIILTTYADEKMLVDAIDAGHIYGYITKPWEPEEVRAIVNEAMGTYEVTRATKDSHIRVLLHSGIITKEQLEVALQTQKSEEKSIEDILIERGIISRGQLDIAINLQKSRHKQLSEALVETGAVSHNNLEMARNEQRHRRRKLVEIIVDLEYTTEENIHSCYALQLGIPHMSLSQFSDNPQLAELIPPKLVYKYNVVPRDLVGKVLVVAALEPLSDAAKIEIEEETGYRVMIVSASHQDIAEGLEEYYAVVQKQEKTQEVTASKTIGIELDGIVQFQHTDDVIIECVIRDITEDCAEAVVIASDEHICAEEDVYLKILLPTEKSPIMCTGKIIWYSESDEETLKGSRAYLARISITDISRIERKRLDLVIAQKRAFHQQQSSYNFEHSP